MSEETNAQQYICKPSAVRRSGKLMYARKSRIGRPGLNPPSVQRLTEKQQQQQKQQQEQQQQEQQSPSKPELAEPTPEAVQPKAAATPAVDDDALESMLYETAQAEEKKLDDPETTKAISSDQPFGLVSPPTEDSQVNPSNDEEDRESSFMSTFEELQEEEAPTPQAIAPVETNPSPAKASPITKGVAAVPQVSDEEPPQAAAPIQATRPPSSASGASARVYHRPHTNQTVVAGKSKDHHNDNDADSHTTASERSGSWVARRMRRDEEERRRRQEEEEEDDDEELSQTSRGNSKRRARMRKKQRHQTSRRSGRGNLRSSDNDSARSYSNSVGGVVSQAFDNMLGYAGGGRPSSGRSRHAVDDGYSSEESESILNDLQDALMNTFGCSVPGVKHHHGKRTSSSRRRTLDDDMTVSTNHTGGLSRQSIETDGQSSYKSNPSTVHHVRTHSNLSAVSGSLYSNVSESEAGAGSLLSFDTTEELADFSKGGDSRGTPSQAPSQPSASNHTGSYKIPEAYDANPPRIPPRQKAGDKPMYSEDLYSNVLDQGDFAPVNLLEEGDNLIDSMGKDLLQVANTKVDEAFTAIQGLLGNPAPSTEENNEAAAAQPEPPQQQPEQPAAAAEPPTQLMTTLSNVTEPLGVITETDEKDTSGGDLPAVSDFEAFEDQFEINVFESVETVDSSRMAVKPDPSANSNSATEAAGNLDTKETESTASLFQGIEDPAGTSPQASNDDNEEVVPNSEQPVPNSEQPVPNSEKPKKETIDWNATTKKLSKAASSEATEGEVPDAVAAIETNGTDTTSLSATTASEKASTDSITVDRKGSNSPSIVTEDEERQDKALPPAVVAPPSMEAPAAEASTTAVEPPERDAPIVVKPDQKAAAFPTTKTAPPPPEPKKKKKGGIKGLFKRSFKKNKKGNKKSKDALPLATQAAIATPQPSQETEAVVPAAAPVKPAESSSASPVTPSKVAPATPSRPVNTPDTSVESVSPQRREMTADTVDFSATGSAPTSRPTTPVHDADGGSALETPKMSNLQMEDKLARPVSGANLADLPGIDEARSFREDPPGNKEDEQQEEVVHPGVPADPPSSPKASNNNTKSNNDGFDLSFDAAGYGFSNTQATKTLTSAQSFEDPGKDVSFDEFDFAPSEQNWESFGEDANDLGAAAYRQKALEDAKHPKVNGIPVAPVL